MTGKQGGLILFNTLMMLSILALLVLSQMQLILVQLKAANDVLFRHDAFQKLEAQARRLIISNLKDWPQECVTAEADPNAIIERLKRKKGCIIANNNQQYQFVIEDLGIFPCLQTTHNFALYSTRHWRLTIVALLKKPIMLQLRIARAAMYLACMENQATRINTGIISWRSGYINLEKALRFSAVSPLATSATALP